MLSSGLLFVADDGDVHATTPRGAPSWYEADRMHLHTRLSPNQRKLNNDPAFETAFSSGGTALASEGAKVFTRHIRSRDEPPLWVTEIGREALKVIHSDSAKPTLRTIAYFWHSSDAKIAEENPDWRCRSKRGKIAKHKRRGTYLDFTTPYGMIVADRLKQLSNLGFDGAYLDGRHMTPNGCFGTALEDGLASPSPRALRAAQAQQVAHVITGWNTHIANPEFALIVSVASLPTLINPEVSTDLARAGIPKTELRTAIRTGPDLRLFEKHPDLVSTRPKDGTRIAAGLSFLRSLSGASPHVWIHNIDEQNALIHAAGQVITHGGIANLDINEADIAELVAKQASEAPRADKPIFATLALNTAVSETFIDAEFPDFIAIHISQADRNTRSLRADWQDIVGPSLTAVQHLLAAGLPVRLIDDTQLNEGDLTSFRFILSATAKTLPQGAPKPLELIPLPSLPLGSQKAASLFQKVLSPVLLARSEAHASLAPLPNEIEARLWKAPTASRNLSRYVVSAIASDAELSVSGTVLKLNAPDITKGTHCLRNVLAPSEISSFTGEMTLTGELPWHVFSIEPCASNTQSERH
jgi:hypothetical protein